MLKKIKFSNQIIWLMIFFVLFFSAVVVHSAPRVFLNRSPETYLLVSPDNDSLQLLPVFFLFDKLQNNNVEFFVIRQFQDSAKKQFLHIEENRLLWKDYDYNNEVVPLAAITVSQYLLLDVPWLPINGASDSNFNVNVCIDGQVDYSFPGENFQSEIFACGATLVKFDFVLSPSSVILSRSGEVASRVEVRDKNGNALSFRAAPRQGWIVVDPKEGHGGFTVSLDTTQLPTEEVTGQIDVTADGHMKAITVKVPEAISINPLNVVVQPNNFELARDTFGKSVKVQDVSGNPLDFTLNTTVNWLKVSPSQGRGAFSVSLDLAGAPHTRAEGIIYVTVGTVTKEVKVSIPGIAPNNQSEVIVEPQTFELRRNIFSRQSVKVQDVSGNPLDFTLNTTVNWLKLTPVRGRGFFDVSLNMKNLPANRASATIKVKVGSIIKNVIVSVPQAVTINRAIGLWDSSLYFELLSGKRESKSVSVTCGGAPASSCRITMPNRPSWLQFDQHCSNGKFNVSVNAQGLSSGFTKKVSLTVSANCGSKSLPITLKVKGECRARSPIATPSSINIESNQGISVIEQNITIKDDCGRELAYEVKEVSGEWIASPHLGDTGIGQLKVKFNAGYLEAQDQPYAGSVKLSTSLGNLTIPIKLRVNPPCESRNAHFEYNNSTISKVTVPAVSGTNPSSLTVLIIDDCDNRLDYDLKDITSSWLKARKAEEGKLVISFASSSLSVGTYEGTITILPKKPNGEETYPELTLSVELKVEANSPPVNVEAITLNENEPYRDFTFSPGKVRLFKLRANTTAWPLSIAVESPSTYGATKGYLYVMVKYAGENFEILPPNENDYENIMKIVRRDRWQFKGAYQTNDYPIYYYFNDAVTKQLDITTPAVENGGWWIWVKNVGDKTYRNCGVFFDNEPND